MCSSDLRLIGRSLRAVTDLKRLGERTIHLDCDVLQADGGTRTAAITGAWVALRDAVNGLLAAGKLTSDPLREAVAAISVGIVALPGADPACVLDLDYQEDSGCETDMNVVMTASGGLVEIQGTAEGGSFLPPAGERAAGSGRQGHRRAGATAAGSLTGELLYT